MRNQQMTLVTLALLACPSDVYDSELFYMQIHRNACSIIVRFIKRIIFHRYCRAELIRNAKLTEFHRQEMMPYDDVMHRISLGHHHVIDLEGNHHIICPNNIAIPELPADTIFVTWVIYRDQDEYFEWRYMSDCEYLAKWAMNRPEYCSDPTGQSIVNLAKFGIFAKEICC